MDGDLLQDLVRAEQVAEDILADKQQIIDFDAKRNQAREAIRY